MDSSSSPENEIPSGSGSGTLIQSMYQKGEGMLGYRGLQDYFLPAPRHDSGGDKMNAVAVQRKSRGRKAGRASGSPGKSSKASAQQFSFSDDLDEIRKERHNLEVLQDVLREREEMLALHEQKVISLREEYEAKLRELDSRDAASPDGGFPAAARSQDFERLKEEREVTESLIAERSRELEKLREEEMRLQMEISRHSHEIIDHQKKFDELHQGIRKLESHHLKKQNGLDDITYKLDMKKQEYDTASREAAKAKKELGRLKREITYDIEKEIKVLAKRVDDHLRHSEFDKAHRDYRRIRELYSMLSKSEKKKVYDKVMHVASELT